MYIHCHIYMRTYVRLCIFINLVILSSRVCSCFRVTLSLFFLSLSLYMTHVYRYTHVYAFDQESTYRLHTQIQ